MHVRIYAHLLSQASHSFNRPADYLDFFYLYHYTHYYTHYHHHTDSSHIKQCTLPSSSHKIRMKVLNVSYRHKNINAETPPNTHTHMNRPFFTSFLFPYSTRKLSSYTAVYRIIILPLIIDQKSHLSNTIHVVFSE